MRRRKIALISSLVLLAFLALAAVGLFVYWSLSNPLFAYRPAQTPPQLKQARVVLGSSFLSRSEFIRTGKGLLGEILKVPGLGSINDIAIRERDLHHGLDIVIAGREGAMVVDRNGAKRSQIKYDFETGEIRLGPFRKTKTYNMLGDIQIVNIDGDGRCQYLARGGFDGAALFDDQGRRVWSYRKNDKNGGSRENVTVGDLNGDGMAEFIVSSNGIEAFDKYGTRLWQRPAEYGPSQIEIVDIDGTGKKKIVSIGSKLEIRDESGNEIKSIDTPSGYVGKFSLCTMPNTKIPTILALNDGYLWLIGFDGSSVAKFDAPLSEFPDVVEKTPYGKFGTITYRAKGAWVKLGKDQQEYLAVINQFAALDRSVLYIYTPSGRLAYQEVLPEECSSIAALPPENDSDSQEFLVGGSRTVWRYRAK